MSTEYKYKNNINESISILPTRNSQTHTHSLIHPCRTRRSYSTEVDANTREKEKERKRHAQVHCSLLLKNSFSSVLISSRCNRTRDGERKLSEKKN